MAGTKSFRYWYHVVTSIPIFLKYRDRSMIPFRQFVDNLAIVASVVDLRSPNGRGSIVECGTWQGGMAGALIELCGRRRKYCFFDSFEGLPPAKGLDGRRAIAWQADTSSKANYDNCSSSVAIFYDTIQRSGIGSDNVKVIIGFFEDALPGFAAPPIEVLRLDGDWYDSTLTCLRKFWEYVVPGGVILIDDYYTWDGCSRAVHDFLSERKATERIRQGIIGGIAFMLKEPDSSG